MGRLARRKLKASMVDEAVINFSHRDYLGQNNLKMAALRFYNIEKSFRDSFSRYKSSKYIRRDFLEPIQAAYHLVRGILQFFIMPVISLFILAYFLLFKRKSEEFKNSLQYLASATLGVIVDGAAQVAQGLIQIVKSPFLLIQIPIRGLLTATKGWQPLKDNAGIKALKEDYNYLVQANNTPYSYEVLKILFRLEEKHKKALRTGQRKFETKYDTLENEVKKLVPLIPKLSSTLESEEDRCDNPTMKYWRRRRHYFGENSSDSLFNTPIKKMDPNGKLNEEALNRASNILNAV